MEQPDIVRDIRRHRLVPLKGLRAVSVSYAPMQALLPPDHLSPLRNRDDSKGADDKLEKVLRQRIKSVERTSPIIQSKLSEAGIEVLSREASANTTGTAYLDVMIRLGKPKMKSSCSAKISLRQEVALLRDSGIKFYVQTWESGWIKRRYPKEAKHSEGTDREVEGLEAAIEDVMRYFIDEYRDANASE